MPEKGWRKRLHDRRPKSPLSVKGTSDGVTDNEKPSDRPVTTTQTAKPDRLGWRKTFHDSRSQSSPGLRAPALVAEDIEDSRSDVGLSTPALPAARPKNETRPRFARYLSEYLSLTAGSKPTEFPFPEPWDEDAPFEIEPPIDPLLALQHIRSHIGSRSWMPLPVEHNSVLLRIFEDYQKVREEKEHLNELMKNTLNDFRVAEESWDEEESRYQAEIRRLELLIAQGTSGMVGLIEARQGSIVQRRRKKASTDRAEVVYKPMTTDQLDSEIKLRSHKAVLHRPTSPSGSMAALSRRLLGQGSPEELHIGTPPRVGHQLTLSRKVKSELDLLELSTNAPDVPPNHSGEADSEERQQKTSNVPVEATLDVGAECEAFVALKELATLVARRRGLNAKDFVSKLMKLYETERVERIRMDGSISSYHNENDNEDTPVKAEDEAEYLHPERLSAPPMLENRHFSFEPGDDQLILLTEKIKEWDINRAKSPAGSQSTGSSGSQEDVTGDLVETSLRRAQTLSADVTRKPSKIPSPVQQSTLGRSRNEDSNSSLLTARSQHRLNDRPNSTSSVRTAFRDHHGGRSPQQQLPTRGSSCESLSDTDWEPGVARGSNAEVKDGEFEMTTLPATDGI